MRWCIRALRACLERGFGRGDYDERAGEALMDGGHVRRREGKIMGDPHPLSAGLTLPG